MRLKNRPHAIVAHLLERVVFVIVTTSTTHGDPKKRLRRMLDNVVEPEVSAELVPVPREEPGRPQGRLILGRHFIRGEHLDDHPVVSLVAIERLDDPVPPPPDVLSTVAEIFAVAGRIAVAPDVHEVSSPPLAIAWALQQAINCLFKGHRRFVVEKPAAFLQRWREAGQYERSSSEQHRPGSFADRGHTDPVVLGREKPVDVTTNPASRSARHVGFDGWQKGPVSGRIFGNRFVGRCGSRCDPGGQLCDLFRRQSRAVLRRWHPVVVVCGDSFQDETLAGRSSDVSRTAFTALPNKTRRIQPQSACLFA